MTSTTPLPCPDCGAPLTGLPACAACGLRLLGPEAVRLWEVDVALAGLEARRGELLTERAGLLALLRPGAATSSSGPGGTVAAAGALAGANWKPAGPAAVARPAREWTPRRVQNTLLGLGALLLTIAGIVFAAVTYDRLGAGGRAAILLVLTAVAGLAVPRLKARGLDATAETVSVVALALAALDAYGLRTLGLAESSSGWSYAAGSSVVLAVACGLYAAAVPVRFPRYAGVVLTQLPVPLLLARAEASAGTSALALSLLAAADLGALTQLTRLPAGRPREDVSLATTACGGVAAAAALLTATLGAALDSGRTPAAVALLVLAALAAAAGLLLTGLGRLVAHALPAPLVAGAAVALSVDLTTRAQRPVVLVAVGLIAVLVAAQLPRRWRDGPVLGALGVTAVAVLTQLDAVSQAVLLPLGWLDHTWTLAAGRDARHALSPYQAWTGSVVALVVLAGAAAAVTSAGLAVHRLRTAVPVAAGLLAVAAVVLPLGLDASYALALVLLLALAVALLTAGTVAARPDVSLAALGTGAVVATLAAVWSTADRDATLLVLPVVAVAFAGAATRRAEAAGLAGLTAGAALAAAGAAKGLHTDQVGGLLLLAPAAAIALTFLLDTARRIALELAATALAVTALVLTRGDAGWLSWALAALAVVALADALHADRRPVAYAGAVLLSASSWVRLADAGVHAPEPYVVPLSVVALVLGHVRRRRDPRVRSFAAYGPGLAASLLPSLVASLDDAALTRPLLLGGVALVVLLVGARERLQAPLVIGGGVLVVDALHLLAPYAAALPRWLTLGAAGLLLVAVGATYEQRRRDLARAVKRYESFA